VTLKKLAIAILGLLTIVLILWIFLGDRVTRLALVSSLFTGAEQQQNFNRMHEVFPSTKMLPSDSPYEFSLGAELSLPERFSYLGNTVDTAEFIRRTDTAAVLVLHRGELVFEDYWLSGGPEQVWLSMSVSKSFVSALIGIAIEQGYIADVNSLVTDYVPQLEGSAYDQVRIKDILQMSSGASWNEDYGDPDSDINRFGRAFALGGSMNKFATTLVREFEPGTYNRYNSTDTQVLGWLLSEATGRSLTDYMTDVLWRPMGAQDAGYWLQDLDGMEMAFGGLNVTARDYAKLGEMYRLGGAFNGRQIVPASWVKDSLTLDADHLLPGENPASDWPLGYGYQWWIPEGDAGEFMAIGVYNQFIYIAPERELVIVKLSANSAYGTPQDPEASSEFETIEFFRALGAELDIEADTEDDSLDVEAIDQSSDN